MTPRCILVGTDFSDESLQAARTALRWGDERTRHVVAFVAPHPLPGEREGGREAAFDALKDWCAQTGLPRATPIVRTGDVARELARAAEEAGADLLVLGHRGTTRLQRLLLGGSARGALRLAPMDTLVVRGAAPPPGVPAVRHAVVATDFQEPSLRAVDRARSLAKAHGARLTLAHVAEPSVWYEAVQSAPPEARAGREAHEREARARLERLDLERLDGRAERVLLRGKPSVEIPAFAQRVDADLVVIGAHGRGLVDRALLGSHAEAIVERAPCSVLLVR